MTIAEFIEPERTRPLIGMLETLGLSGTFPCSEVCLAVPDEAFHFTVRRRLPLSPAPTPRP
jgi:hypothetical protein